MADHLVVVGVPGDDGTEDGHGLHVVPAGEPVGRERRVVRPGDLDLGDDLGAAVGRGLAGRLGHPLRDGPPLVVLGDHESERYHVRRVV